MADVLTIDPSGTPVTLDAAGRAANLVALGRLVAYRRSGIPSLSFYRILGPSGLGGAAYDAWDGKAVTLTMDPSVTLVFAGDVQRRHDSWHPGLGWVREYACDGLAKRADYIPVTDSNRSTDLSIWNSNVSDPDAIASREGKTVAQIVQAILEMQANGRALTAAGIGNYTVTGSYPNESYALPSTTTSDLSALSFTPLSRVSVQGERILQSLEGFLQAFHPNHCLHVEPTGTIRFLDQRSFTATTIHLGDDSRLDMFDMSADWSECYGRVEVRGETMIQAVELSLSPKHGSSDSDGGLQEDFAWGSYTNLQAKQNFKASDWQDPFVLSPGGTTPRFGSSGSLTTASQTSTTVLYTSSNSSETWASNYWSSGNQAWVTLYSDAAGVSSIEEFFQARISSCTALTAGGTSTLTLDRTLPSTLYKSAQIYGMGAGATGVYIKYKVTNTALGAKMVNFFPYPVPYVSPFGNAAVLTSAPMGTVIYTTDAGYTTSVTPGITCDPGIPGTSDPHIYFPRPTALMFTGKTPPSGYVGGVAPPDDVRALVAVATGTLTSWAPSSSSYSGTGNTVLGLTRTKIVTIHDWKDYSNQSQMDTYAGELLDSIKDVVFEGTIPYHGSPTGLFGSSPYAFGHAVQISGPTGGAYTTGFESIALPVVEMVIDFHEDQQGATWYDTTLHVTNRRLRYSADTFLRPNLVPRQFGFEMPSRTSGIQATLEQINSMSTKGAAFLAALGGPEGLSEQPSDWGLGVGAPPRPAMPSASARAIAAVGEGAVNAAYAREAPAIEGAGADLLAGLAEPVPPVYEQPKGTLPYGTWPETPPE